MRHLAPLAPRWAVNAALGVLYAAALVLVFALLGYVSERTEGAHRTTEDQLAAAREAGYLQGLRDGEDRVMAVANSAWQAAERMQQYAAEHAQLAQAQGRDCARVADGSSAPWGRP